MALEVPGRADPIPLKPDHIHDAGVIDPKTRALPLQIEVDNRDGQLLVGQTGTAILYTGRTQRVPVVPQDAVLMEAGRPYVFVQIGGERFARRFVEIAVARRRHGRPASGRQAGRPRRHARRLRHSAGLGGEGLAGRRPRALMEEPATMKRLIQWSIEHHWLVIGLSLLLLGAGAWTARQMPIDVFPDLTAPTVTILTEGHGMAPEEMESLVTFPLESAINGASGVRRVRSATAVGIAVVWVEFDWGTDIFMARQLVAEKLTLVSGTLPPQVERPVLAPVSSIMGEILFFAISSEHDDPLTLRTIADTTVRRRLLAVPGVSQVTPIGGAERQFQVIAHPDALRANNVTLTELLDGRARRQPEHVGRRLHRRAAGVRPRSRSAACGRRRRSAKPSSPCAAIGPVLVRDVADVREGGAFKRGEGSRSGKPAVIVGVQKQPGANTIEVTRRLDRELDTLQRELPAGMTIDRRIFRQADFIEVAVDNVVPRAARRRPPGHRHRPAVPRELRARAPSR